MKKAISLKAITSLALSFILAFSVLTAFVSAADAMSQIETINYYGDFENGISGDLTANGNPQIFRFFKFNSELSSEQAYRGNYSLKSVAADTDPFFLFDVNLEANTSYAVSINVPSAEKTSSARFELSGAASGSRQGVIFDANRWTECTYAFTTAAAAQYRVVLKGFEKGKTYYFDCLSFKKLTDENTAVAYKTDFGEEDTAEWTSNTATHFTSDTSLSGEKSLMIAAQSEIAQYSAGYTVIPVAKNTDYVLHFYGKRASNDGSALINVLDEASGSLIGGSRFINGAVKGYDENGSAVFEHTEWGLNEMTFNSGNNCYIKLIFSVNGAAAYADDIYLAKKAGSYKSENEAYGTVSGTPKTLCFGEEFTLTAAPNNGYSFAGWYDGQNKLITLARKYEGVITDDEEFIAKFFLTGDLNEDDEVDTRDIALLRKVLIGVANSNRADVNGNGKINITDLISLKKVLAAANGK